MLSALIPSEHSYPAFALGRTTGTPEVRFSRSSRTEENSPSSIQRPHQIETDNTVTLYSPKTEGLTFLLTSAYRYAVRTVS
jgi:hypothetical protein